MNREWGRHLEIVAMSVWYNACIKVKELSPSGEHVTRNTSYVTMQG